MNNFQYNYFNYKPNKSKKNQLSNYLFRLIYIYIYVGSRFSGWAQRRTGIQAQRTQYNEYVESGSKSWTLMGQRLVWKLGMIKQELRTEPNGPTPRGKGLLIREYELPPSLTPPLSSLLVGDLLYYISLPLVHHFPTFVSHPCPYLSARPIIHSF